MMTHLTAENDFDFQQAGKEVLQIEREGLEQLDRYINDDFTRTCDLIYRCRGKVVVMGMGKSGHIGKKLPPPLPVPVRPLSLYILLKPATAIWAWSPLTMW